MKACLGILLVVMVITSLTGCMDRIDLEDATITLMAGIDLNEKNEILFYLSSPVFSEEAKKKSEEFGVKADTFREARVRLDEMVTGLTLPGKIQVYILGKRLLQHPDWFRILDVIYRDARSTVNSRMVVYDGDVHELFHFNPVDKPRLALHLTKLIDTAARRVVTVKTEAQELHRQILEKGTTPVLTEMTKDNRVVQVKGIALLSGKGTYAKLIEPPEATLLMLMVNGKQEDVSISLLLPEYQERSKFIKSKVSMIVKDVSNKIETSYRDGRFHFTVRQKLKISIAERLFPFDMKKGYKQMEREIEKELRKSYAQLIQKCQKSSADPIGFGMHARAYEYEEWKKVRDNWTKEFSRASVQIIPEVSIKGNGIVK